MNNELEIEFRSISVGTICPNCQKKIRSQNLHRLFMPTHGRTNSNHLLQLRKKANS